MRRMLQPLAFGLVLLMATGCGDRGQSAPTPVPGGGNPTGGTPPTATQPVADTAGGPPVASAQADDLVVSVYKVLPYEVPAAAPSISQPKAGMQAVILDLEVKSKKASLLKVYVSGSKLLDAGGAAYGTDAAILGYYLSVCGCIDDQAAYNKFVDGNFQPDESARTFLAYTVPKGTPPAKLQMYYMKGVYKDETEALMNGKETSLLVELPH